MSDIIVSSIIVSATMATLYAIHVYRKRKVRKMEEKKENENDLEKISESAKKLEEEVKEKKPSIPVPKLEQIFHPLSGKKYVCVILNSPKDAIVRDLDVSDGQIMYRDKIWNVDESIPIRLKTPFGERFMYILHWRCPKPLEIDEEEMKIIPMITPEFLKRIVEIKFVHLLMRRQVRIWEGETSKRMLVILMALAGVVAAFFILRYLRVIPW